MRITNLSVSNFLSFAPEPNDFQMNFSSENLTVVVGPNGAGKSNVFRAIRVILDSLMWNPTSHHSVDVQNLFFQVAGRSQNLKITMGVHMNTPFERELMSCFIKAAMVNPDGQLFQGVTMPDGSVSCAITVGADRVSAYANFVESAFDNTSVDGLLEGTIEVLVYSSDPYVRNVRFLSKDGELEVNLLPNGGQVTSTDVASPQRGMSLANAWIDGLSDDVKVQLKQFLTGEADRTPTTFPKFNVTNLSKILQRIMAVATVKIGNVSTPVEKNIENLYNLVGGWRNSNDHFTFTHIFRFLISHGIALFDRWIPLSSSRIDGDYHPIRSLIDGNLALHLFKLKNGSQDDRDSFISIQKTYKDITGTHLDVVLSTFSQQEQFGQTENFTNAFLVVDKDIPLSYAGSGRAQVALLVSAMHLPHGVLFLDEPDTFLHPSVQANLIESWKNRNVQSVIVTHSPYMVPVGGLEHVRRIYSHRKSEWSVVSPRFSVKQIEELGIQRQIKRSDEAMLLFAKCVVLVEGYDEQIALPIWFDKWLEKCGRPSSEALGVRFHAAFGKTGIMPLARIAEAYGIEWIALYDADIMSSNSNNRNDNRKVIQQFIDSKQIEDGVLHLGLEESIERFPIGPNKQIFVRGIELKDSWETMDVYLWYKERLAGQIGMGPMISRFMAEGADPPPEFDDLFNKICEVVEGDNIHRGG